jgi:thiol:disulfide interchange protein DsbA
MGKKMSWMNRLIIACSLLALQPALAEWGEGWDPVDPPVPTTAASGKIEVLEFFWYGCPHCYDIEPEMEEWLSKQSAVDFRLVPAPLNEKWAVHSHFYYAAEALGVLDKLHKPLFDAMHKEKKRLFDKQSLIDFAVRQGVDREAFTDAWNSFSVFVKVQQARKLGKRFQLTGVPTIGINGQYKTSASLAGSTEKMFQVMDELIAEESKTLTATP